MQSTYRRLLAVLLVPKTVSGAEINRMPHRDLIYGGITAHYRPAKSRYNSPYQRTFPTTAGHFYPNVNRRSTAQLRLSSDRPGLWSTGHGGSLAKMRHLSLVTLLVAVARQVAGHCKVQFQHGVIR